MADPNLAQTRPHDVLVIGAGGSGLRAAIEAKAAGADVGLVCKSLLGKAHTVMAEGGIAAALGHVAADDSWQIHFRDTMVGGKLPEQPAHGRAPRDGGARPRPRARGVGGRLRPDAATAGSCSGRSAGHTHPRLAHVGDRTGLEMIRTLQDRAVALGITVYMECTITRLITSVEGRHRCLRLLADDRDARSCSRPRRSSSRPAASARPTRSPRTRGSTAATARRWPTRPAPSSSTWSSSSSIRPAWSGRPAFAACS